MRRIACVLLCLALCCALVACGRVEPEAVTAAEITSEALTTAELMSAHPWKTPEELALSETITVYEVFNGSYYPGGYDIWLRDSETGEEALLLEAGGLGGLGFTRYWTPDLGIRLSERYFSFHCHLPETCDYSEVMFYDAVQRRIVEVDAPGCKMIMKKAEGGRVYLYNSLIYDEDDDWDARVPAFYFDISALDSGGPVALSPLER